MSHENKVYYRLTRIHMSIMMQFKEIIAKSQQLLESLNKIAAEAGGTIEHQSGPFGNTYPRRDADAEEDTDLPENIENEKRPHFKGEHFIKSDIAGAIPSIQQGFSSSNVEAKPDSYVLPTSQATADNCTDTDEECARKLSLETRQQYDTGLSAQRNI